MRKPKAGSSKCKLCGKSAELVKVHIFPDSFHGPSSKGHGHKLLHATAASGDFNDIFLCEECAAQLAGYEAAVLERLGKGLWEAAARTEDAKVRLVSDVDYKAFKLYFLSLFWRLAVSEGTGFPDIGDKHREAIRKILVKDTAGKDDKYSLTFSHVKMLDNAAAEFCGYVGSSRYENTHVGHSVLCEDLLVDLWMGAIPTPDSLLPVCLHKNGSFLCAEIVMKRPQGV